MPSFHSFDIRRLPVRLSHAPMMLRAAASSLHRYEAENVETPHASGQVGAGTTLCRLSRMITKGLYPTKIYTIQKTQFSVTDETPGSVHVEYIKCDQENVVSTIEIWRRKEVVHPGESDIKLPQLLVGTPNGDDDKEQGREVVNDTPSESDLKLLQGLDEILSKCEGKGKDRERIVDAYTMM